MKRFLLLFLAASALAQDNPFAPNPVFLIKYGTMTTDLDAKHHKILNLDTSNLPGGGTGTVTNIATTPPITGGPITTTGTLGITDFVASGVSHARGSVPDPGAILGTTKFLREDATWAVPSGGGTATHAVTFFVDGSGTVLTTGTKNPVKVPYGGTIQGWVMMCKPSGSVTADVLRAADGAGLPVTSIVGAGTKPAIATNVESSGAFPSWTSTTITANDNFAINITAATTATYCQLTLYYQ